MNYSDNANLMSSTLNPTTEVTKSAINVLDTTRSKSCSDKGILYFNFIIIFISFTYNFTLRL